MKKQTKPLVSVIMPVYNAGKFLVPAIESILNQTYRNFELIIVDDASTDGSWNIIRSYQKKYPKRISTIKLSKNLNAGGDTCANLALAMARGEFVARMDADDISCRERLEKQVTYLLNHPRTFIVGSNADVISTSGEIIGEKKEPLTHQDIKEQYFTFHPLIHPSTMFRRTINGKPFSYKLGYSANNDYYTFFSLLCEGQRFANLPDKLLRYRIHGENDTFKHMKVKYLNTLKIRIEMCIRYQYTPTFRALLLMLAQTGAMFLLPEFLITKLYLHMKGIKQLSLSSLFVPILSLPRVRTAA